MHRLRFHPLITKSAFVAGLTAIGGFSHEVYMSFGPKGLLFNIAVAALLAVCAFGESAAPAGK